MMTVQENIMEYLRTEIASFLDVDAEKIDVSDGVEELGLNSSAIVSLVGCLEERYGAQLSPTLFFEHRTIQSVAAILSEQIPAHAVREA